jgi:hypothetical protein
MCDLTGALCRLMGRQSPHEILQPVGPGFEISQRDLSPLDIPFNPRQPRLLDCQPSMPKNHQLETPPGKRARAVWPHLFRLRNRHLYKRWRHAWPVRLLIPTFIPQQPAREPCLSFTSSFSFFGRANNRSHFAFSFFYSRDLTRSPKNKHNEVLHLLSHRPCDRRRGLAHCQAFQRH